MSIPIEIAEADRVHVWASRNTFAPDPTSASNQMVLMRPEDSPWGCELLSLAVSEAGSTTALLSAPEGGHKGLSALLTRSGLHLRVVWEQGRGLVVVPDPSLAEVRSLIDDLERIASELERTQPATVPSSDPNGTPVGHETVEV